MPGHLGHGLLAGVDEVRVHLLLARVGADAQHAVLRLQHHLHARPGRSWRPGSACRCRGSRRSRRAAPRPTRCAICSRVRAMVTLRSAGATVRRSMGFCVVRRPARRAARRWTGRGSRRGRARRPARSPRPRRSSTRRRAAHHRVEVARRLAEDEVAPGVGLPGLDQGEVAADAAARAGTSRPSSSRISLPSATSVPDAGGGVEAADAGAAGADALGQRALRARAPPPARRTGTAARTPCSRPT